MVRFYFFDLLLHLPLDGGGLSGYVNGIRMAAKLTVTDVIVPFNFFFRWWLLRRRGLSEHMLMRVSQVTVRARH